MELKRNILTGAVIVALCTSFNVSAFGLGSIMGGGSGSTGGGDVGKDIDTFLKTADDAHALTTNSAKILGGAVLTKEVMDKDAADRAAANNIQDPKEKEAALAKADKTLEANLAKVDYDAKSKEIAKQNDKKKNAQIGASMFNFVLGLLKDKDLAGQGSGLISSASSNPMMATKLIKVKDVVASISGQVGDMGSIATGLQKMSSTIKSVPMPASASETPKDSGGE